MLTSPELKLPSCGHRGLDISILTALLDIARMKMENDDTLHCI